LEEEKCETVVLKKAVRKDLTIEKLDQEFRELNAAQIRVNTRMAVEQMVESREEVRKKTGLRMMRAEEESVDGFRLPPVSVMLKVRRTDAAKNLGVENVKGVTDNRGNKTLSIPAPVVEELDLESGEEEEDFEKEQRNEVRVEIPQDILAVRNIGGVEVVEKLSSTFLQNLV